MKVRIPLCPRYNEDFPTLVWQIENNPIVKKLKEDLPGTAHICFLVNSLNEICQCRNDILNDILEAKKAGYDVLWLANDTTNISTDMGICFNHFEYLAGAYHHNGVAQESLKWSRLTRGLYLPGKIYKPHRLGPIKYLHEAGLLKDIDYSLKLLPDRSDSEYMENTFKVLNTDRNYFVPLEKDLDFPLELMTSHDNQHYIGYPYDLTLYSNTGWSLISETSNGITVKNPTRHRGFNQDFQDNPWLTEKTYRAIYNSHPFILLGEYGSHDFLNSMGYQTFEKFYGVEIDNFWPNINHRNNHTEYQELVRVVKRFMENLQIHQEEIADMVKHNKQNLIRRYDNTKALLKNLKECIHVGDMSRFMPLEDFVWKEISYKNLLDFNLYK